MSVVALASAVALAIPTAASAETDTGSAPVHTSRANAVRHGRHASATTTRGRATGATRDASATGAAETPGRRPTRVLPAPTGRGGGPSSGGGGCSGADRSSDGRCAAPDLAPGAPQENNEVVPGRGAPGVQGSDGASIGPQGSLPGNASPVQ